MGSETVSILVELRGFVMARRLLDREIASATVQALRAGENRTVVAELLGVSRATLYRQFGPLRDDEM